MILAIRLWDVRRDSCCMTIVTKATLHVGRERAVVVLCSVTLKMDGKRRMVTIGGGCEQ